MAGDGFSTPDSYLLIVLGILFVHASYQLSVSVLTHMSSHSLSRRVGTNRLLRMGLGYTLGAIFMTTLVLVAIVSLTTAGNLAERTASIRVLELIVAAAVPFIGLLTALVYFRRGAGTQLWLPRPVAAYLLTRSRKTKSAVEAFFLGGATVLGELPFIIAPILLIAVVISTTASGAWLLWSLLYSFLASLPLLFVVFYISSGHSVARVQHWREENKRFLQWTSGIALVMLTVFVAFLQLGVLS